jgi:hypothetical protein
MNVTRRMFAESQLQATTIDRRRASPPGGQLACG